LPFTQTNGETARKRSIAGSENSAQTRQEGSLHRPPAATAAPTAAIQSGAAGAQRVFEVLDRDPVIQDLPGAKPLARKSRELRLDNVTFGYDKSHPVLKHVSATIPAGEMVAFVGPSGVGKSTLLNLLPRFYDPGEGAVRLDGINLREAKLRDVRQHVALVLQDSVILPTTIAENIAYGRPGATDHEIREAARLARCAEFIEHLPKGYDTIVAEGGANLSGGQRQRISIARALLTRAPIIILDEPTSALDPHHEQLVTESLESLKGMRTLIIVSHRLSTVRKCDQIFVMSAGRVVEHGTHAELVEHRGLYYDMARKQLNLDDSKHGTLAAA
jgi:ABC-type multidrug transport system fused ATPase/permease subunit